MFDDLLLVGVDGGATEVKAHAVGCAGPGRFFLSGPQATRTYAQVAGFTPVPLEVQLAQRDAGRIELTPQEAALGRLWVEQAAAAIAQVARAVGKTRVLVGIGMPGLKTPDGRGICVINNGPRIPDYLSQMEQILKESGLELVRPIAALGSDADYCGLGEEYAAEGLFRDVQNAYYLGGGTGLADALKLAGRLVPLDQARGWLLKSWQIPSALGPTFEQLVSMASINRIYASLRAAAGSGGPSTTQVDYPECAAARGNALACGWLNAAALILAELLFERLLTVFCGRPEVPHRGQHYAALQVQHPYRGLILERIVLGQWLGELFGQAQLRPIFAEPLEAYLAAFIWHCGDRKLQQAYLDPEAQRPKLRPQLLRASNLRAAPALGAAAAAACAAGLTP